MSLALRRAAEAMSEQLVSLLIAGVGFTWRVCPGLDITFSRFAVYISMYICTCGKRISGNLHLHGVGNLSLKCLRNVQSS